VLSTNAQPGHFASQFVEPKRNSHPLFTGHGAVPFNLKLQRGFWRHPRLSFALNQPRQIQSLGDLAHFVVRNLAGLGQPGVHR